MVDYRGQVLSGDRILYLYAQVDVMRLKGDPWATSLMRVHREVPSVAPLLRPGMGFP